ncbi:pirin family protein [Amnibacterium endophyticum]|uniref:Pirin family protein n=1 Tax=Amnibacterium endophyticum TaxID=2109337 RepID=A0ABW4LBM4_9MICO
MSVTERDPDLIDCAAGGPAQLLEPREVPLGGPRAMRVQRSLPQRSRSLIGAWCFVDHYGPDDLAERGGMHVPGHPHTGLATVTWLFEGEVEHRDTTGAAVVVRPGEVNLMTAGRGVAHSEHSAAGTTVVHGAQLWFALPDGAAEGGRALQHAVPQVLVHDGAEVRVFVGDWLGSTGAPHAPSPLIGAEVRIAAGRTWRAPMDPAFEVGLLVDLGEAESEGIRAGRSGLIALPPGRSEVVVTAGPTKLRLLVLAGEPFPHDVVMWWNFVGRTHDEVVAARADWQQQVEQQRTSGSADGRFGPHPDAWDAVLPAPELPTVRLRPRRRS